MFNFLFDGKIGDILAPVVPSNQLFLAIQHHKNNEIQGLLDSTSYNPSTVPDGGYAAVHVASRYNNRYAIDLLLARGTSLQAVDQQGNTPLHYAAKYGNLDMCKYLIEKGAHAHVRNRSNQTAYDSAENHHLVRQYLLPVQLAAERGLPEFQTQSVPYGGLSTAASYSNAPAPAYGNPPVSNYYAQPPPLQPVYQAQPPAGTTTAVTPPPMGGIPPMGTSSSALAPPMPVVANYSYAAIQNQSKPSTARVIQPDGFHSSASDPVLQQKYGHTVERSAIAPPPTGATPLQPPAAAPYQAPGTGPYQATSMAPPPPMAPPAAVGGGQIYNRYVPYDAHNNTAAPVPMAMGYAPAAIPAAAPVAGFTPPTVYPPSTPTQAPFPSNMQISTTQNAPSTPSEPSPPQPSNRLLGNKAVFSPPGDAEIVNLGSSSSSVL